jgi:hypothetical protein
MMLSVTYPFQQRIVGGVNNKLERICKDVVVA